MSEVLRGAESFAVAYFDDMAMYPESWAKHLQHMRGGFGRLREARLTVKPGKYQHAREKLNYLAHMGIGLRRSSEVKLFAISSYPQPATKTAVRAFSGFLGYYRQYIAHQCEFSSPLSGYMRNDKPERIVLADAKENSFQALKKAEVSDPVLRFPDYL